MKAHRLPFIISKHSEGSPQSVELRDVAEMILGKGLRTAPVGTPLRAHRVDGNYDPHDVAAQIRDASLVLVDGVDQSAATYVELGMALALRKPVLLVIEQGTDVPSLLQPLRSLAYASQADLEGQLRWHLFAGVQGSPRLPSLFSRCGLPFEPLERNSEAASSMNGVGAFPISVEYDDSHPYALPTEWESQFRAALESQLALAKSNSIEVYDGPLARLFKCDAASGPSGLISRLDLGLQRVSYFQFLASNYCWDYLPPEEAAFLRASELQTLTDLKASVLANPLSISVCLVVRQLGREWVVFQARNTKAAFHGRQPFQCAAAGLVVQRDTERGSAVDVLGTAKRKLFRELGLDVQAQEIQILGLVRETAHLETGVVAEVTLDTQTPGEISARVHPDEVLNTIMCPLHPDNVAEFIAQRGGLPSFAPLGLASVVYSLLKRFPPSMVETAFERVRG